MTEILEWIDPSRLHPKTRYTLEAVGPSLVRGLTHKETGARLGRSEDWVAARVRELRSALVVNVLETSGDQLPVGLKRRLERYVGS